MDGAANIKQHGEPHVIDRFAPDAKVSFGYPSIAVFPNGRLVATATLSGPGVKDLPGKKGRDAATGRHVQTRVYGSTDAGQSWTAAESLPLGQAVLFRAGSTLYAVGHCGMLQVARSPDGGATWSRPATLALPDGVDAVADGPRNLCALDEWVYFACMVARDRQRRGYAGAAYAPVLYRAHLGVDLAVRTAWTVVAEGPTFAEFVPTASLAHIGVPFYDVPDGGRSAAIGKNRWADAMGWHDAHTLAILDPQHGWRADAHDGLVLICTARTHRGNFGAAAALRAGAGGRRTVEHPRAPSGQSMSLLPMPGAHLRFALLHDADSQCYWLVSNAAADSMRQTRYTPRDRYGLPCDDRRCLQLHASLNLVDWCMVGVLARGADERHSFHMPAAAPRGPDLCVVAAAGLDGARNARDSNALVFLTVPGFRNLETPAALAALGRLTPC
jgi:hypothetical protein